MADKNSTEHNTKIGTIAKNSRDTIVVQIKTFKNKYYLDIRNHYTDLEGNLRPTQKGISLEISRFNEIKKLIDDVAPEIGKLPPLEGKA